MKKVYALGPVLQNGWESKLYLTVSDVGDITLEANVGQEDSAHIEIVDPLTMLRLMVALSCIATDQDLPEHWNGG